mmetsp:Transcript_136084/g.352848  ORF Transcript_136084/g.352848 Transcript_136084/m.352848 type:complete len:85 (-) Transcript_136084:1608-1862(-)
MATHSAKLIVIVTWERSLDMRTKAHKAHYAALLYSCGANQPQAAMSSPSKILRASLSDWISSALALVLSSYVIPTSMHWGFNLS